MTEWLANLSWQVILAVVVVLVAARLALSKSSSWPARAGAEITESLAIALTVVYLVIKPFIFQAFFIPTASMHPTLLERDHLVVNKITYRFNEPEYGDIIVFRAPPNASEDGKERDFIKRLIGKPGDTIEVRPGYVNINYNILGHREIEQLLLGGFEANNSVKFTKDGVVCNGRRYSKADIAAAAGYPTAIVEIYPGIVLRNNKVLNEPYIAEDPDEQMAPYRVPEGSYFVMGDNRNKSSDSRHWGAVKRERILGKAAFIFWPKERIGWIR